jgi:hypothetical protein
MKTYKKTEEVGMTEIDGEACLTDDTYKRENIKGRR